MPTRARRICTRCRRAHSEQRCPTCAARTLEQTADSWYKTAAWRQISRTFLRNNPRCSLCDRPARIADHWPTSRKQLIADGDPNPDAFEHMRPLCHEHHRSETARLQPGGWNAPRG